MPWFQWHNLVATKADLQDRGIIIQLERIPDKKRHKIKDIWNDFNEIKAQCLGYIFDILVKVIKEKEKENR